MRKILDWIEDILIFLGLSIITFTTYLINFIAGLYLTGTILFLLGLYFAYLPPKRR